MQERTRDTVADKYFVVSRILLHPTTSLRLVKCGDKRRVKYGDQHNYLSDIFTANTHFYLIVSAVSGVPEIMVTWSEGFYWFICTIKRIYYK